MTAHAPTQEFRLLPFGFPVSPLFSVHWSFPVALFVVPALEGSKHGPWWGWVVAVSMPLLFCILVFREFGRRAAVHRLGLPARRVTIWPLGHLTANGEDARGFEEARVALAGPLVSLLVLGFFALTFVATGVVVAGDFLDPLHWWPVSTDTGPADFGAHVLYLVHKLNLLVLLVNLAPVRPLDGGRFLRGVLSRHLGNVRADRGVAWLGIGVSFTGFVGAVVAGLGGVALVAAWIFLLSLWSRRGDG